MTVAYRWLLWMLSLLILVALPSAAGARLVLGMEKRRDRDIDDQKYHRSRRLRYIGHGLRILLAVPLIFIRILFDIIQRKFMSRRKAEPVLGHEQQWHGRVTTWSTCTISDSSNKGFKVA